MWEPKSQEYVSNFSRTDCISKYFWLSDLSNIKLSCSLDTKVHISKGTTKKSTHKETNLDKIYLRHIRCNFSATADDIHNSAHFL